MSGARIDPRRQRGSARAPFAGHPNALARIGFRSGDAWRRGRASWTVLLVVIALAAGAVGGYWVPKRFLPQASSESAPPATDAPAGSEQWYTCGMHPNVLQEGPGECPICHMKLTPLKKDDDAGAGAKASKERKVLYWRAPMDPNFISEKPGKSPMGMDLVPVYAEEAQSASGHTIRIDPVTIQNMGIRTEAVRRGPLVKTIRTVGRVDYDERRVTFVDTKFSGWIERLSVDETGQFVEKGQSLFEVYSPELYGAQEEYLAAMRNLPRLESSTFTPAREAAGKLVEAAETKLRYLDVSDGQIARLRDAAEITKTLSIYSPARGIVTEKMALEGMYVKPGMRLFTIADLSRVWVYVDVYEYELPWIHIGQTANMTLPYLPGAPFVGTVVYIYPYLDQQTRVIQVRLEFENPSLTLKPGMFANIKLESELSRQALLIPRAVYIDSGERKVAFVDRGDGKFAPRDIQVGVEAENGMVEVLYGLDEGEVVVTSGQFLLDAESKLKEAVAKMMEPTQAHPTKGPGRSRATDEHAGHDHDSSETASGLPQDAAFACPMEKHPDQEDPAEQGAYFSPEPGQCPWCGMNLKPLEELDWVRVRRAAKGGDVAYTCPDHQHVFSQEAGACPRCGDELEPFKVMYTCPDPAHAGVISTFPADCPHCGKGPVAYRGVWLGEDMADENVPAVPGLADVAAYRCPIHPLVHSDEPGACTICARPLEGGRDTTSETDRTVPADARFTCPMKECWHFSTQEGECPVCGMNLKPLDAVDWVKEMRAAGPIAKAGEAYVCPMHPEKVKAAEPGTCPICGMKLVHAEAFQEPVGAPAQVAAQMNYLMEHYLELQTLLASDRAQGVARQALAIASASDDLLKHLPDPAVDLPLEGHNAARELHQASLKITGTDLTEDRVVFVQLSAAMSALIEVARPSRDRWPKLYVYHCPMSKGDWIQAGQEKRNPYYGFKMLSCGVLKDVQ